MKISKFVATKVDSKEGAVQLLSEFLTHVFGASFPGVDELCNDCGQDSEYCECERCEECCEAPMNCYCEDKENTDDEYDDCIKEASAFAKKWDIPFDVDLHKAIIDGIGSMPSGVWNSSSAYC